MVSSFSSTTPLWYITRSSAIVAFVLLTVAFAGGLAATQRVVASRWWPRFATQDLHRNLSLLAMGFIVIHVVTTLADTFVNVGSWSSVVPFVSDYRSTWVGLGTLALDVLVVVIATSLVRHRLSWRVWRAVHWTTYAAWPLALVHFLKTGTDSAHGRWGLYLGLGCLLVLVAATAARLLGRESAGDNGAGAVEGLQ